MDQAPAILWLIGGKKADAREQRQLLEQPPELEVRLVPLRERVEDYADLAANPDTGAVLISGTLWKRSDHAYTSVDVAAFLRSLRVELPIFLIGDDVEDDDGAFDGVIDPRELRRRPELYRGRLLRATGRYQASLSAAQQRLQQLLDRQINGALTPDEAEELLALRALAERAAQVKLAKQVESLELDLAEKRAMVEQLEALAARLERRASP